MNVFICLLAAVCLSNATLLTLLGGGARDHGSKITYNIAAMPSSGSNVQPISHSHVENAAPQVIKVILTGGHDYSNADAGGYTYQHGQGVDHDDSYAILQLKNEQIYKVIEHKQYAEPGSVQHHRYAHNYGSGLNAILPQILQFVLEDDAFGRDGSIDYNAQLIDAYGHQGSATVTRSIKEHSNFFKEGHVVQHGELKVARLESNNKIESNADQGYNLNYFQPSSEFSHPHLAPDVRSW